MQVARIYFGSGSRAMARRRHFCILPISLQVVLEGLVCALASRRRAHCFPDRAHRSHTQIQINVLVGHPEAEKKNCDSQVNRLACFDPA
jgi:hypothetical protein